MTSNLSHHDLCELVAKLRKKLQSRAETIRLVRDQRDEQTRNGFVLSKQLQFAEETIARVRRYCQARNNPSVNLATHTAVNDVLKILGEE